MQSERQNVDMGSLGSSPDIYYLHDLGQIPYPLQASDSPFVNCDCLLKAKDSDTTIFVFLQVWIICCGKDGAKEGQTNKRKVH